MKRILNKRLKKKKIRFIIILCFVISSFLTFGICMILSPRVEISNTNINLAFGEEYREPLYHSYFLKKDISKLVHKKGSVNPNKLGVYEVEYSVSYLIFKSRKVVRVSVVDKEAPIISLEGGDEVLVCPNLEYQELGFHASDNYDGDLTDKVSVTNHGDHVVYDVEDSSHNKTHIVRKITKGDVEKPVIQLKGSSNLVIYTGSVYHEDGYVAHDNCDGDLTSQVVVSGSVNSSVAGTYTISYHVKDSSQNEGVVTRVITVRNYSLIRPSSGGSGKGIVYLTFDDGPNEGTTNVILDVLKREGVSATFFVTCNGPDYLIKRMFDEGHTVALHTASHNYNYVYRSKANYFSDLERVSNRVERITGVKSMIIRFPGGSSNTISKKLCPGIMTELTQEVKQRGYHYFDWNVDSNDAGGAGTSAAVYYNVISHLSLERENVVLMHDIKSITRDAISNIIHYGKENGFTFRKITYDTVMVVHGVNN